MTLLLALACTRDHPGGKRPEPPEPFPAPDAFAPPAGPGAPRAAFPEDALWAPCGAITEEERDHQHHNLSVIDDGWLVHPWAPEDGGGGVSFWDFADPCEPALVGSAYDPGMRETHALAFGVVDGRKYLAVDWLGDEVGEGGVGFFDVTDPAAPEWVSSLATPNFFYPDAYLRVTFATFWQGDVLYVASALNGLHVIDVSDPRDPVLVSTVTFDTPHLVGHFVVIGNLGVAFSAGTPRTVLLDVSDPYDPRPIAGGTWDASKDGSALTRYYFASVGGKYALLARNDNGGGPMLYDLTDPSAPTRVGSLPTDGGDGGYVYRQGDFLFQGDSNFGLVVDVSDPANPVEVGRFDQAGDLDTVSPIGNVMVVSVDENGDPGKASQVFPWATEPDADPPAVELVSPLDGAVNVAVTSRIGLSFDEWVESATVFAGSFRVADDAGAHVAGRFYTQENVVNFVPDEPLAPDTGYVVEVPAGGIRDVSGNPTADPFTFSFRTSP